MQGTAAAHTRARESSILSTATDDDRFCGPNVLRYRRKVNPQREHLPAYTSRVLVHGFDSKSNAAGFKSSAVCLCPLSRGPPCGNRAAG